MKRKLLIVLLVLTLVASIGFSIVACNGGNNNKIDDNKPDKNTVVIETLPDMIDYGADSKYYQEGTSTYSSQKRQEWIMDLEEKQDEERIDWIDSRDPTDWPETAEEMKAFYVSFGAWAESIKNPGTPERQSNIGYFDVEGNWIDDESANTVQRIFVYATAEDFIQRMSEARVEEKRTDGVVKYICRDDEEYEDRGKGTGYVYTIGEASALEDYAQLEELQEIYDDFDAYEEDSSYADHIFDTEEEVQDALNRKKRKIYGEIFAIFEEEADQFARCAIELVSYAIEVIESVMIPAYNNAHDATVEIMDYIRYEMFDHETLSYFLAFMDDNITQFNNNTYKAVQKKTMMSLYGYYYQYQKRDYEVFDDSKMVKNDRIGTVTEYQDFLELNHKSYFDTDAEALRYRNYDRRHYKEAYRYSYACYQKYYTVQLTFQSVQEEKDLDVYVGGATTSIGESLTKGQYKDGIDKVGDDLTYSAEMQKGCAQGLESTLKLSDVNWEYTADDKVVLNFNAKSKDWNGLSDDAQGYTNNKIKKVEYELAQLKSQDYAINHVTITTADLTKALQYQVRSYSADSIRSIQAAKKDEVTYYLAMDRFLQATGLRYEDIKNGSVFNTWEVEAYYDLEEDAGRNDAKFINLDANYTIGTANDQVNAANNADWAGVKSNIKETLAKDYVAYSKSGNTKLVDEYFEDTLIRKEWSCGTALDVQDCPNGNGHRECSEEYDTDWALSRLLDTHEVVLRYMAGQAVVTFKAINEADFIDPAKFYGAIATATSVTSTEAKAAGSYKMSYKADEACVTETLGTSDEIGTACTQNTDKLGYPVAGVADQRWNNVPVYESKNFSCGSSGTELGKITYVNGNTTYTYTFIGWYVDENFKYPVLLDEAYNYDIRLYPCYRLEKEVK